MVLLGTRAVLKDNLGYSTAELAYGAPLHLPGELFSASDDTEHDATNYANQLHAASLQVTPTHTPSSHRGFIPLEFSKCTDLLVHHETARKPIQQPFERPYKVLQHTKKTLILDINSGRETVSIKIT